MSTEDEVRDLMSRASALPYGRGRSQLWAEAAALAESAGLEELALRSNLALIPAYTNGGEGPKLLAPFIWCNAVYKRRPELFTEKMLHRLGWDYKYVITALRFIPTVPRDQCLDILEEMRRYYLSRGDSMRAYYIHGHLLYRDLGEEDAAEEAFQKWRASGPSDLADCAGCDPAHEIDYFRRRKDWEAACRVGDRALADREHYCFQQPESLLTDMLEPWLRTGRDAEAWAGHIRAYRRYQADSTHLSYMPNHIDYLRLSGTPERLERARRILVRHLPWWEQAQYPRNLIDLAVSAARLVRELPGDRHAERLHAILPGEKLKWAPRRTLADPTLADAEEWFTSLALDLADQCDRRPGLLRPFMVAEIRERLREPGLDRPLTANAIPDVSGMATLDTQDYRIAAASEALLLPDASVVADRGASAGRGSACAAEPPPTPEQSSQPDADEEPPLVPVDIDGPWRTMDLFDLVQTAAALGPTVRSVYLLRAAQILCDRPVGGHAPSAETASGEPGDADEAPPAPRTADPDALPEAARFNDAWLKAQTLANAFLGRQSAVPESDPDATDPFGIFTPPAFLLMVQARALAEQSDFRGACLAADGAMRIVSPDPLGVRLEALEILSSMSAAAGYPEEAMEYARALVNLSAACDLAFLNATASDMLANMLLRTRRPVEAAEVAQMALLRMEAYPHSPLALRLHASLASALEALDDDTAAAHAAVELADLLEIRGDTLGARNSYSRAAQAFSEAGDSSRSVALWAHVLRLTEEVDTPLQVANTLNNYAYAIATQPGRVPEDQLDLMDRLMERRRALLASPSVEMSDSKEWLDADWLRSMALFDWYALRRRLAKDYARASADAFASLDQPIERGRTLMLIVQMCLAMGELDEADALIQEAGSLLDDQRFRGHELLQELEKLRESARQARQERDEGDGR